MSERRFPLRIWRALKAGDYVRYRRSGWKRRIASAKPGFISFNDAHGETTYVSGDRYMFSPVIRIRRRI